MLFLVILRGDDCLPRTLTASRRRMHVVGRHLHVLLSCPDFCSCCTYRELTQRCVLSFQNNPGNSYLSMWPITCTCTPQEYSHKLRFHTKQFSWTKSCYCDMVSGYAWWISNYWSSLWSSKEYRMCYCSWSMQSNFKDFAADIHPVSHWWWFTDYSY